MLKKILSITGRPGLVKIVAQNSRSIIVEDLATGNRFPALSRDKIVSLGDIAMYTDADEKPLSEVLDKTYEVEKGEKINVPELVKAKGLKKKFEEILPNFDQDRVHDSDIKKLFTWYNILVDAGFTRFTEEEKKEAEEEKAE